jgi:hypothetical protein
VLRCFQYAGTLNFLFPFVFFLFRLSVVFFVLGFPMFQTLGDDLRKSTILCIELVDDYEK